LVSVANSSNESTGNDDRSERINWIAEAMAA